ncbi:MAG TPA: DNA recombination protein RmuC, partial [Polyangiales bacterium]
MSAPVLGALLGLLLLAIGASGYWWRRSRTLALQLLELQTRLHSEQQLEQAREQAMQLALERAKAAFDQVADQSLRSNTELFLKLAREHLGQHQQHSTAALTQREQAIEAMLLPIRDALGKTEQQIQRIEKERAESFGSLRASLEAVTLGQQALQRETRTLVNALRRPEVRGQWGELTLRRLVELAGMLEHCDFSEQVSVRTEQGALRPDMIVHMPDGRDLVVDVKTPLDA